MKRLTNELIDSNTKLNDHQKKLFRGFVKAFPGSTIECISKADAEADAERRKESSIPANREINSKVQQTMKTNKPNPGSAWRAQTAGLFEQKETLNEQNDNTNRRKTNPQDTPRLRDMAEADYS